MDPECIFQAQFLTSYVQQEKIIMLLRQLWPLLFFIVPLVEIFLLIQVGSQIGAGLTVLIVIITAAIGVTLLRQQGLRTIMNANQAMQQGQMPAKALFDGFLLAIVGVLLLTPGFLTDTIGFLLLIPGVRSAVLHMVMQQMTVQTFGSTTYYESGAGMGGDTDRSQNEQSRTEQSRTDQSQSKASPRRTLDGEYWKDD